MLLVYGQTICKAHVIFKTDFLKNVICLQGKFLFRKSHNQSSECLGKALTVGLRAGD